MNIHLETNELQSALNKILTAVDKKNTRPILTYTLVTVNEKGFIELAATDTEVSAKVIINANVNKSGKFCVNAKNLFEILRELPDTKIELKLDQSENLLKLFCGDIHYSLVINNAEDYPHISFGETNKYFHIKSEQLLEITNRTSYAILNDETRLHLNGIFLQEVDQNLRSVATDGHRLSLYETQVNIEGNEVLQNGIIIPKKGVSELKKLAEAYPNSILNVFVDESFMYINAEEKYFVSIRLIGREYPKYQAVIPSKTTYTMFVEKNLFLDAMKRIKIMANEKSNGVRISLSKTEITIIANHPSLGHAEEKLPVNFDGNEIEIGFNAKYLIDTLNILEDGEVSLELNNEISPVIIKSTAMPSYLGIIMPLKL